MKSKVFAKLVLKNKVLKKRFEEEMSKEPTLDLNSMTMIVWLTKENEIKSKFPKICQRNQPLKVILCKNAKNRENAF